MEKYAKMLRLYLGSAGCKVSMLDGDELLEVAKLAYDVPGNNIVEVAIKIQNLGKRERSARVREALLKHWPRPTLLWPPQGNMRKLLAKNGLTKR
jgi:hypothetical protein